MKNLSTVLETLNSDSVCLPDSIVKSMLSESGLMILVSSKHGRDEKLEISNRVKFLGQQLINTSYIPKDVAKDVVNIDDLLSMEQYRDTLLAEAELIQFVMEYRKKLNDDVNKDFDWSSIEKKDDKPKIVGKVDLTNGI